MIPGSPGPHGGGQGGQLTHQCPRHEHYPVPTETSLVEILDEQERPCFPG
jgi:hypothetical protein